MLNWFQHLSLLTAVSLRFLSILLYLLLLSIPYFFRPYIVRDIYGIDTEQIRSKYGKKGKVMFDGWQLTEGKARSNYAFNRAQIGVNP